jgi:Amt family ammonium transporter
LARPAALAVLCALALPSAAMADSLDAAQNGVLPESVTINSLWVTLSAVLVLLMLAGLLCLEAGMSRMKNVGTLVPKALISMAVAAIAYYACGFAFAFGNGDIIGSTGFLLQGYGDPQKAFGIMGLSDALIESKWLFQCAFACVTLGIVWGSTLERIKFHAHVIFAAVFAGFIYPLASHWVFGGGWLQTSVGMQDFAGSTAVHLVGATGALAGLLMATAWSSSAWACSSCSSAGSGSTRARRWASPTAASPRWRWSPCSARPAASSAPTS